MALDPFADPNHPRWEPTAEELADPLPPEWNRSRHDPWWRAWLTSWQLFESYRDNAPRFSEPIRTVMGGTVYEYNRGNQSIWVQAWLAPGELIVAYPSMAEQYNAVGPEFGGPHEFEVLIGHLRESPALGLGRVRDRSSYGARWGGDRSQPPEVKWAAAGDWAALARNWYFASSGIV